jgi:Fic family protein
MKMPRRPPSFQESFAKVTDPEWIIRVMSEVREGTIGGKYLHWHKLRFYPPPEGLTHEQWWFGVKMRRLSQSKEISLLDKAGKPFSFNLVDPIPEFLHLVDSDARGILQTPEPITNPDTKKRYLVRSLMEEAISSSQLEGASTSHKVAKEMIRQGRKPRDRSEQMIFNNYVVMQHILEARDQRLSKDLVFEIHRIVTENTLKDHSAVGRFRGPHETVVVDDQYGEILHEPPAAKELESRMEIMCAFANGDNLGGFIHPVIRSMIVHFWLAYDHPFVDGNGRTARALFYWSMLRQGYWLFEFIPISRIILQAPSKYAAAYLYTETDDNDLTYFLLYHSNVIRRALSDLYTYLERRTHQVMEAVADLKGLTFLNHRQRDLINHSLRNHGFIYTVESHKTSNNISYETARHDLMDLVERKLMSKHRSGRFWHFIPVNDLEAKLRKD